MQNHYNVIVIGAGPGGSAAAVRSAQYSASRASVLLIEKEALGGTCLNKGCIPTKTLLHSAAAFRSAQKLGQLGIRTGSVELDLDAIHKRKERIINQLRTGLKKLIDSYSITQLSGEASFKDGNTVTVQSAEKTQDYTFDHAVIACGSIPCKPHGFVGADKCISSDEALNMKQIPKTMVIAGAGILGLEFAALFNALGTHVTLVECMPDILPTLDREIVRLIFKDIERQGIKLLLSSQIIRVDPHTVQIKNEHDQTSEIQAEKVLWAVGRTTNIDSLHLDNAQVVVNKKGIVVDSCMRSSNKKIFAVGDTVGKYQLAYTASAEGVIAAENISGKKKQMEYNGVPSAMYTEPNCAWVGLTEEEALKKEGAGKVRAGRFSALANSKALIKGTRNGMIKIITDDKGMVLGVHMIGAEVCELISMASYMVAEKKNINTWRRECFSHPSLIESLFTAGEDCFSHSVDLPKK